MAANTNNLIRVGKVSSVNVANGTIKVSYPQLDKAVTTEIPYANFADTYKMPQVGSWVIVLHLSTGASAGICLGNYWGSGSKPPEGIAGLFRQDYGAAPGEAYLRYLQGALLLFCEGSVAIEGASIAENAGGNMDVTVGGNLTETVTGNLTETVTGETLIDGTGMVTIKSAGDLILQDAGIALTPTIIDQRLRNGGL